MVGKFVGRKSDLAKLDKLLKGPYQHITIHGFGGLGKTALALQAAKDFDSGKVLALSLVGTPKLAQVIRRMARFLGVNTDTVSEFEDQKLEVIERLTGSGTIVL